MRAAARARAAHFEVRGSQADHKNLLLLVAAARGEIENRKNQNASHHRPNLKRLQTPLCPIHMPLFYLMSSCRIVRVHRPFVRTLPSPVVRSFARDSRVLSIRGRNMQVMYGRLFFINLFRHLLYLKVS